METYPDRMPLKQWPMVLVFSGVWLWFLLISAVFQVLDLIRENRPGAAAVCAVVVTLFCLVYLASFVIPRPVRRLPRWANTLGATAIMVLCLVLFAQFVGPAALYALPYFASVWIFQHPLRIGLPMAGLVAGVGVWLTLTVSPDTMLVTALSVLGGSIVIMVLMRLAIARDEALVEAEHQVELAGQREQLARDLHDVLGHSLTVINVKAQLVSRLIQTDPQRAAQEADDVVQLSRTALAEARAAVATLAAPELGAQLSSSVSALRSAGIAVTAPPPGAVAEVPAEQRALAAWFLREAVTNVLRHAHAQNVTVTLDAQHAGVHDDGVGLPADVADGAGLRSLRGRIAAAGAQLETGGPGTRVVLRWASGEAGEGAGVAEQARQGESAS